MINSATPPLVGLVLAGGQSSRMGADKGSLILRGQAQAASCFNLLSRHCADVLVSVSVAQSAKEPYCRMPTVVDIKGVAGPAAGLIAATDRSPGSAILVLAVDMLFVDDDLIAELIDARDPACFATAFRTPGGLIEPLCAIWEPTAGLLLRRAAEGGQSPSPRLLLENAAVNVLEPRDARKLVSVNTQDQLAKARQALDNS